MTRNLSVLSRVSSLAIAAVLTATAAAQSFQGEHNVAFGGANVLHFGGDTDIEVFTTTAVIDWTPDDPTPGSVIAFQEGGTATFHSGSDFAVLNRINAADPSRQILLNGTIQSIVGETTGRGSIFFYSPSGFVVGSNAIINVGNLVLSASPIAVDGNGGFINGTSVTFNQAPNSNAAITTALGSQINAFGSGSYVALVAPQITHQGTIRTDTAAALVAAEAATINFSPDGLFNIEVSVGADGGDRLHVDGGTIARNSAVEANGNVHRAYLVAVAKNDAVTMLIDNGGSIGFDTATSAAVGEDNSVILSGGGSVFSGTPSVGGSANPVNLEIDSSSFSSDVHADLSGSFDIRTSSGDTRFGDSENLVDLTLFASGDSIITAINGNTLAISGTLFANVDEFGTGPTTTTGNLLRVTANGTGSTLTVGESVFLSAAAYGSDDGEGIEAGDATGGTVIIQTGSGSTIDIVGEVGINVDGYGGDVFFGETAGSGTGGAAHILANGGSGSSLNVGGTADVSASGFGGSTVECSSCLITGGAGFGGTILLQALVGSGNQLNLDSDVTLTATGGGGAGDVAGGAATGGNVQLISGDAGAMTIGADLAVDVSAHGGFGMDNGETGGQGGAATGGFASISFSGTASTIDLLGTSTFSANAFGGDGVIGGNATGGWINLQVSSDGALTAGFLEGSADAFGGTSDVFTTGGGATGGSATGGRTWLQGTDGGSILVDDLWLSASGIGGDGNSGNGGAGTGGSVIASANNASLTVNFFTSLEANGEGGTAASETGIGGLGTGGEAELIANNGGTATLGSVDLLATGIGGFAQDGTGGDGIGNLAHISATGGDITINGSAFIDVSGFGGNGINGGDGAGGGNFFTSTGGGHIRANDGDITIGSAFVRSDGQGGIGSSGGDGGDGTGGWASIEAGNSNAGPSLITIQGVESSAFVSASGLGGHGGDGIPGIDGEGGGTGTNGDAGGDGGDGGTGTGGVASITAAAGNGMLDIGVVSAFAWGVGGNGGDGGNGGLGGNGDGGAGGNGGAGGIGGAGGAAVAGLVTAGVQSGSAEALSDNLGSATFGFVELDASAFGGDGGAGGLGGVAGSGSPNGIAGADGNGGAGGFANGGSAYLVAEGGLVDVSSVILTANATGGDGGSGAVAGIGGDAESDEVGVLVSERIDHIDQRGELIAGNISGTVIADGGSGSTAGVSFAEGGSSFIVENGDATIGLVSIFGSADLLIPDLATDMIAVVNGEVLIDGDFSFVMPGQVSVYADSGSLTAGTVTIAASNFIHDPERSFPAAVGTISADTFDLVTGQDLIIDAHLISTASLNLSAPGLIDIEDATSGGDLTLDAGSTISGGSMTAANSITADAGGDINLNLASAGTDIDIQSTAGGIFSNAQSAGGSIVLDGATGITTGDLTAGTDVLLNSGGTITTGGISAFSTVDANGGSLDLGDVSASVMNFVSTVGDISTGDLIAFSSLTVDSADDFLFGSIVAPLVDLNAPGSIIGGFIDSETDITAVAGGDIDVGDLTAGGFDGEVFQFGDIALTAGGDIATGLVSAAGAVSGDAGAGISMLDISAFDAVDLSAGASIATGNVDSNSVSMVAGGDIATGDIFAFGAVSLDALGFLSSGDIVAGTIDLLAGEDMLTGDLTTQIQGDLVALLFPGASITLEAGGDIATGDIDSIDGVYASAGGGIATGTIDAVDFVQLLAGANVSTGEILAGGYIDIFSSGGGIATGDLTGAEIDLEANGDISFGNVDADSLDFDATGAVTGGDIVAFSQVGGDAEGAIILGDITVGPGLPQVDDFSVGIASATSITVGNVSGTDRVGLATFGDLTTGNLSADDLVMTLVGGDIVTGSITTQSSGIVYMADASMFIDAGGGEDNFDASLVLALDPVPTGGSITLGGPVSTGLFQAAAGTGLTTGAIDAETIEASAGGTATLNGLWSAQDVTLASNDIDITGTGGISGIGLVTLISTNATQALIGDGLTGTGYALSNAEFGRIEGGSVHILARGDASAAIDMLIGDLTVTGPSAGSTIENSDGILVFATGDVESQTPGGVIRIVGEVAATGFGAGNAMEFHADRFELDAATGSISLTSSGGALAGELGLYADQIHVAEGSILDQLAIDPQYAGYQDDLNAPAAVQRPGGVLNAGVIWIESENLQSILIQNTGTAETPAGFLANEIFVNEDFEVAGPPGSIDVVVNGQLITETGTLTGVAVRDALVEGEDLSPFTANSTINGCLLSGPCGAVEPPEPPFPPGFTPTPGIQQEILLIKNNLLPPPEFDNENFIDDNDETTEEGETSPIEPPQPLFDTSGLGDKGDVDDPVSGSGNPSLMETPPPSSNQEKRP